MAKRLRSEEDGCYEDCEVVIFYNDEEVAESVGEILVDETRTIREIRVKTGGLFRSFISKD